jgi:hypothetical protein
MKEHQPEIRADSGTESIGKSAYNVAASGDFDSRGFRSSVLILTGFIAILFFAMMFTRKEHTTKSGVALSVPTMGQTGPPISAKLLTEKDLTNIIGRPKISSSATGHIKVVSLRSMSELPVGSEVSAVLESGATDGIVKAKLLKPLVVDGEAILPERAVLFGKGKSSDERLFVEFSKVIWPTGESYSIRAQAFDLADKILGLKGSIVGTRTKKMGAAMAFGLLGGMADSLQESSGSYFMPGKKTSTRDAALAGASKAALDQSQAYLEEMKRSPNIIEVKTGTEFIVIVDEPKRKDEK